MTEELGVAEFDYPRWSSRLVWSNLYKISPCQGGNPGGTLSDCQQDGCRRLFKLELEIYRPDRLLLLTGEDWAKPFLDDLSGGEGPDGKHVQLAGRLPHPDGSARVVVAVHPQGKSEDDWVREVLGSFS